MKHADILRDLRTMGEADLAFARERFSTLSEAQANWKPSPKQWSVAQCLEHINITNRHWNPQLRAGTSGFRPGPNAGEQATTFFGRMIHAIMADPKKKAKTGASSAPAHPLQGAEVWSEFQRLHQDWMELGVRMAVCDLDANKVRPPALGFLKWRLGEALRINTLHTGRHLRQAERVMAQAGFPKA